MWKKCLIFSTDCLSKLINNFPRGINICPTGFRTNASSSCCKKTFNTPHPPKDPPENYNPTCINHEAFNVPDFIPAAIFRPFTAKCEKLGPGADKRGCYKNAEYYAYHRYSFIALQLLCLELKLKNAEKKQSIQIVADKNDTGVIKCSSSKNKK